MSQYRQIKRHTHPTELYNILKFKGSVASGGDAKQVTLKDGVWLMTILKPVNAGR